ncbi:N-lysine methyltransferase setd6 [Lingula anatina]|uniref:N-lysine methyltransferase n=1 Tax=Lingula anatina TaxID=7574 RepID=A0A1S3K2B7_LINAN|nr:N-lysine methyltransferase setd6 [Lingula anatina]|eukprot:XP_013416662.1 N-lysine methyltransferase setd6 [Lingula anatina]
MESKRKHEDEDQEQISPKKVLVSEDKLLSFFRWCRETNLRVSSKVLVTKSGSSANYGMVATEDIPEGKCLFEIPRSLLLSPQTCAIAQLLESESSSIESQSGWVPLLLALMYEYTNPQSKWKPYLELVPEFEELHLPMFWERSEMEQELRGTGVIKNVDRDLEFIEKEFSGIVLPFVKKHEDVFPALCQDFEFYKKMVAFVMAYSFTEPVKSNENGNEDEENGNDEDEDEDAEKKSPPMMVPMADILNHVAKNNAHLSFDKDCLRMVSTKPIREGEEVFNTYGQLANWQLLHMYGFAEPYPNNNYDTVDLPLQILYDVAKQGKDEEDLQLLTEKWQVLQDMSVVVDDAAIILGTSGILTEEEAYQTLKVLCMNKEEFAALKENIGWMEVDDDISLKNSDISKLPKEWLEILARAAKEVLKLYHSSMKEDELLLKLENFENLTPRQQYSLYVRYGQRKLLQNLLNLCSQQPVN